MNRADPVARWTQWIVRGTRDQLDAVITELDSTLPAPWKRVPGKEGSELQGHEGLGAAWYRIDTTPDYLGAAVCVEQMGGALCGGHVVYDHKQAALHGPSAMATWPHIIRLLEEGIAPAARSVGAEAKMPTTDELFLRALPPATRERLEGFSVCERKSLPLDTKGEEAWREFALAAFRERAVVEPEQLTGWLAGHGWPRDGAEELDRRFRDHWRLLARYREEVSGA